MKSDIITLIRKEMKMVCLKNVWRDLFFILTVILCVEIFILSAQNGKMSQEFSQNTSENLGEILGGVVPPSGGNPTTGTDSTFIKFIFDNFRKIAHTVLFFGLGVSVTGFIKTFDPSKRWLEIVIPFAFCLLYACFDELHQFFVPGRGASIIDVLIDSIGFSSAILLMNLPLGITIISNFIKRKKAQS